LGYTTLRAPDGRLIVLPNAIAASQVTVNLNSTFAPWPLSIAIRVSRDADIDNARQLALQASREKVGEAAVVGCFLTRVDSAAISLDLRLRATDAAGRDAMRTQLLSALPQRFAQAKIGTAGNELPTFN
jgi:small-conductance mechanosensitive channel